MRLTSLAPILILPAIACAPLAPEEVQQGAARVERPAPGTRVWQEILFDDGTTETLEVLAGDDDGDLVIFHAARGIDVDTLIDTDLGRPLLPHSDEDVPDGEAEASGVAASATTSSPSKCRDPAFTLMGHRWTGTFEWRFKAATTPTGLGADRTELALRSAMKNITRQDNPCGASDLVDATASYKGRTDLPAQVTANGACSGNDGDNVVGFGDLPAGVLGVACVWSTSEGEAVSADVRFNKVDHRWTNDPASSACRNRYDVESVATHEFGHVFGVGHVSEQTHGRLVMSTAIDGPCQARERQLGSGDMRALRSLY